MNPFLSGMLIVRNLFVLLMALYASSAFAQSAGYYHITPEANRFLHNRLQLREERLIGNRPDYGIRLVAGTNYGDLTEFDFTVLSVVLHNISLDSYAFQTGISSADQTRVANMSAQNVGVSYSGKSWILGASVGSIGTTRSMVLENNEVVTLQEKHDLVSHSLMMLYHTNLSFVELSIGVLYFSTDTYDAEGVEGKTSLLSSAFGLGVIF